MENTAYKRQPEQEKEVRVGKKWGDGFVSKSWDLLYILLYITNITCGGKALVSAQTEFGPLVCVDSSAVVV